MMLISVDSTPGSIVANCSLEPLIGDGKLSIHGVGIVDTSISEGQHPLTDKTIASFRSAVSKLTCSWSIVPMEEALDSLRLLLTLNNPEYDTTLATQAAAELESSKGISVLIASKGSLLWTIGIGDADYKPWCDLSFEAIRHMHLTLRLITTVRDFAPVDGIPLIPTPDRFRGGGPMVMKAASISLVQRP